MLIGPNILSSNTFVAAGSTQATATELDQDFCVISSGTGGVRLPQEQRGLRVTITNKTGSAVNVYPPAGGTINALSANAAYSLAAGASTVFSSSEATSATTNWMTESITASAIVDLMSSGTWSGGNSGQFLRGDRVWSNVLTSALEVQTSGTSSASRALVIKNGSEGTLNFTSYAGSWRPTLQIQSNGANRALHLIAPNDDYTNAIVTGVNGGIELRYYDGTSTYGYFTLDGSGVYSYFKNDTWHQSKDGKPRLSFGTNGRTYYGSQDGHEFRSSSDGTLAFLTNAGAFNTNGKIQSTGWNGDYASTLAVQMGISSGQGYVHCYNGTAGTYGQLNVVGTPVNINNGYLYVGSAPAVQATDSWLRLNNSNSFSSGIYTPGSLRVDGTLYTGGSGEIQTATGYRWAPDTNFYIWNTSGYNYGSWRMGGARSGWSGLIFNDTGAIATMMHNGTYGGMYLQSPGRWSFYDDGTFNVGVNLSVAGAITASSNITAFSDVRLKEEIETIDSALDKVCQLRGVSFKWKKDGVKNIGVIAQEIERVFPEVVTEYTEKVTAEDGSAEVTESETYKTVAYGNIVAVLIEAIKELREEINTLRKEKLA